MTSTVTLKLRHFSRYSLGLVLLLFMINLSPSVSLAGDDGPEQVIQQISERLLAVLVEERDALKSDPARLYQLADEILVPHIDFAKVSSLVLGKHWSRATPNQQEAFQHAFQRLLVRTYSTAFTELQEWEIRFLPTRASDGGDDTAVRTQLLLPQVNPIEVLYHMHLKEGNWLAYDVKIDGISLVTNYRTSFNRELRTVGMDGLIRKITVLNEKRVQKQDVKNS
ncbi:MAG: ABC transporter substrate-binding protein [Chromatiaceae bacterium]|nr:ABC transporter substrate-binding protein [Gammaproteobacteria bacterium]MCB1879606.1 ABC transporter substrate-binding protein [Gammaproteobacteria bacterium]MCP5428132.1 ABC transporter substrate-binding protein [Chromatiaceae bacterium]MCP5447092.1 ABC transporter substrate-binding protein [Chromatiaceae bacterium]